MHIQQRQLKVLANKVSRSRKPRRSYGGWPGHSLRSRLRASSRNRTSTRRSRWRHFAPQCGFHTDRTPEAAGNVALGSRKLLQEDASRILLEALPDPLLIVNGDGHIMLANTQAEKLFGYEHDALLGQSIELLVPERFRGMHVAHRAGYCRDPYARPMGAELELFARHKNGRDFPVEISLSPLHSKEGTLVITTIRDIRARKHAEAELRKIEARYRALVEGIPAVTFTATLDEGANELYVSPQIEALLGFSQQEWLENPILWYTQLHPDDRPRWHVEFAHTCATGEPFQSIYRFIARDGRVVWVRGEAKLVRDDQGQPLCLQGVAFDLTAIKEAEEGLKALNQTLEQRVAERTAIAEHRAEELERSNAALEQFGYIIAHDLRQPLRTIKSYTQKLAERHLGRHDAETDDALTRTNNAGDRMRVLIDDLLAYSRVSTQGKDPVSADCGRAVVAACGNLEAAIEECAAEVTCDEMPTVMADGTQVAQLFQNLIANALKFRTERSPQIHISCLPWRWTSGSSPSPTTGSASSRNIWSASSSWVSGCTVSPNTRAMGSAWPHARKSLSGMADKFVPNRRDYSGEVRSFLPYPQCLDARKLQR